MFVQLALIRLMTNIQCCYTVVQVCQKLFGKVSLCRKLKQLFFPKLNFQNCVFFRSSNQFVFSLFFLMILLAYSFTIPWLHSLLPINAAAAVGWILELLIKNLSNNEKKFPFSFSFWKVFFLKLFLTSNIFHRIRANTFVTRKHVNATLPLIFNACVFWIVVMVFGSWPNQLKHYANVLPV